MAPVPYLLFLLVWMWQNPSVLPPGLQLSCQNALATIKVPQHFQIPKDTGSNILKQC